MNNQAFYVILIKWSRIVARTQDNGTARQAVPEGDWGERESEGERDREKIRKRELDAFQIATPHIVTGGAIV